MADEKYLALQYIEKLPELAKYGNLIVPYDTEALIGLLRVLQKISKTKLPEPKENPPESSSKNPPIEPENDKNTEKLKKIWERCVMDYLPHFTFNFGFVNHSP